MALARGPAHGYAIGAIVHNDSLGSLRSRDGTTYRAIASLHDSGLIELAGRDRQYAITPAGQTALQHELKRYHHVTQIAGHAVLY